MPVRQRGKKWQADVVLSGKRHRKTFSTHHDAESWVTLATRRHQAGQPIDGGEDGAISTLSELLEATHARYWAGTANERNARRNAEEMVELLGPNLHPSLVNSSMVDRIVVTLKEKGNSNGTINRKIAALRKMMGHSVKLDLRSKVPSMDTLKESEGRVRWYTEDEERRLITAAASLSQDFAHFLEVLVDTGARLGEAQRLRVSDVTEGYVKFFGTKSGKNRAVPLTSRAANALATQSRHKAAQDLIFPQWTHGKLWYMWGQVLEAAGIDDSTAVLHSWRHTFCSRLISRGVGIRQVQKLAGHSTVNTTLRYSHLAPDDLDNAIKVLESGVTQAAELSASA